MTVVSIFEYPTCVCSGFSYRDHCVSDNLRGGFHYKTGIFIVSGDSTLIATAIYPVFVGVNTDECRYLFRCLRLCGALLFSSSHSAYVLLFVFLLPLLSSQEGGAIFQERFATLVFNSFATFEENVAQNVSPRLFLHTYRTKNLLDAESGRRFAGDGWLEQVAVAVPTCRIGGSGRGHNRYSSTEAMSRTPCPQSPLDRSKSYCI